MKFDGARRARGWLGRCLAGVLGSLISISGARAEIYKYKSKTGSVIYTDNLSQLPAERRAYYQKVQQEREEQRKELERKFGKEEVARREVEAKRAELARAQLDEAERAKRLAAIDAQIRSYHEKDKAREASKGAWQKRVKDGQQRLQKLLAEFKAASDAHDAIAIKPLHLRLPGEAEEMERLERETARLEREVDQAIDEVEVKIPEDARKAAIPPGWLR